jgi:membrane-associated phospholipid phosphatase
MSEPAAEASPARGADDPGDWNGSPAGYLAYRWAVGLGAGVLQSLVYFAVGNFPQRRSATLLAIPLDSAIPLWTWTVWLYLPFYAGIFALAITGLRRRRLFHRAFKGVVVTILIGALGHLAIAAEYPRPPLPPPPHGLSEAFLAWLHAVDPAGNVFPSLHVAHTSALALVLRRERPLLGALAMVMALLLALSTLTIKQHFIVDVLAGWAIALVVSRWVLRPFPAKRVETQAG